MARKSIIVLLKRAILRRCPACGRGALFSSHFQMNRTCSNCHVIFWKDPGEAMGAMYLNYALAIGMLLAGWLILAVATSLALVTQIMILSVLVVASVLVFYPFSRSLWTLAVYLSGGLERPRMRLIRGGRKAS